MLLQHVPFAGPIFAQQKQRETNWQNPKDNMMKKTVHILHMLLSMRKRAFYGLRFTNHGKRVAKNVKIVLREEFIQSLTNSQFVDQLSRISKNECVLGVNQSIDIYFGGNDFRENANKLPIEGDIIYSDDIGEYSEHFIIDFNSYPPIFIVDSEIEDIRQELKKQTTEMEKLRREITLLRQNTKQENENA